MTALLGYLIIPIWGWRPMFIIAGIGSLIVWYLRKNLPESPRWLESQGRNAEAESLMQSIEKEAARRRHAAAGSRAGRRCRRSRASDMLKPPLLQRMLVGCWVLITINTLIFGFVIFLPQFFLRQGLTIASSLGYTLVLSAGSLVGCALGAYLSDAIGRRWSIIGASVVTIVTGYIYARFNAASDPAIVLSVGCVLIVAIYIQTAILFGVYTPELFPTEIRLRANGICNTLGRGATVFSPFIVGCADGDLRAAGRGLADDRAGRGADRGGVGLGRRAAQSRAGGCRHRESLIGPFAQFSAASPGEKVKAWIDFSLTVRSMPRKRGGTRAFPVSLAAFGSCQLRRDRAAIVAVVSSNRS